MMGDGTEIFGTLRKLRDGGALSCGPRPGTFSRRVPDQVDQIGGSRPFAAPPWPQDRSVNDRPQFSSGRPTGKRAALFRTVPLSGGDDDIVLNAVDASGSPSGTFGDIALMPGLDPSA